jgi:DNA-binding Xre family transcriptional regulator
MPVSYNKLFLLMETKGLKKYDLRKLGLSPTIVNRLVKNGDVNVSTILRLCEILDCQPGDIMEYIPDAPEQKA